MPARQLMLRTRPETRRSSLQCSTRRGEEILIWLLRSRGADPMHANEDGKTPVRLARLIANYDVARFRGSEPSRQRGSDVAAQSGSAAAANA